MPLETDEQRAAAMEREPEALIPFCAHADTTLDARDTRWPAAAVAAGLGWTLTGDLPGVAHAAVLGDLRRAFARISSVCGLKFFEASGNANIIIGVGPIDGESGILAQSSLPPANPCQQLYDSAEQWNRKITFIAVALHELGHALGLQHDPNPGALLSAFYDPAVQDYQPRDIQRLQALYGPPTVVTPPPPSGGSKIAITVEVTNADLIRIIDAQGRVAKVTW